jgi:hypothetical protein
VLQPLYFLRYHCHIATLCAALGGISVSGAVAQDEVLLDRGFGKAVPAYATGEERNRQTDLRVMELQFKPLRMMWVEVTNPKTGAKERKEVWYLVYRAITRPSEKRPDVSDRTPVNAVDPPPKPTLFMPEVTLQVYDDPDFTVPLDSHLDQVIPEALAAIRAVEQRPPEQYVEMQIEDHLTIIQPFPAAIAEDAPIEEQKWIYGVATWTGVDPETDFLQITMRGFSNAFELRPARDGSEQPWRKVITQKFSRRGDRLDPDQKEFEFIGEPMWDYQPDETDWTQWSPPVEVAQPATATE